MTPCENVDCHRWISFGRFCFEHDTIDEPIKKNKLDNSRKIGYDATTEQIRGIGCVTSKRVMVTRIKSVRKNNPVSYYNMFSTDMMKDMDKPLHHSTINHTKIQPQAPVHSMEKNYEDRLRTLGAISYE